MIDLYESIDVVPSIKEIEILDTGIIDYANIYFKSGLNLILGRGGSGKTTVLNCIKDQSKWHMNLLEWSQKCSIGEKVGLLLNGVKGLPQGNCLLMDDLFCRLDKTYVKEIADACSKSLGQVIATVHNNFDIYDFEANLIDTQEFDLK